MVSILSPFSEIDEIGSKNYVLIALHKQPDSSVDVASSAFLNQLEAIKTLVRKIPMTHDVVIKDHCFIIHHVVISGFVTVESNCIIAANSTIRNRVTISKECIIGMGTLIMKNTVEKGVYAVDSSMRLPLTSDRLKDITS